MRHYWNIVDVRAALIAAWGPLGQNVTIVFSGPVSTAGALTVTPTQRLDIATRFELVLSSTN